MHALFFTNVLWFWDTAQNMLIFGQECSTPLTGLFWKRCKGETVKLLSCGGYGHTKKKQVQLLPIACAHCILTTKFARNFFYLMMCVCTNHESAEKYATKWFFDLNMLKTSALFICKRNIKKDMTPTYILVCVCVYTLPVLLIKRLSIAVFLLIRIIASHKAVFACSTGKILNSFFGLNTATMEDTSSP